MAAPRTLIIVPLSGFSYLRINPTVILSLQDAASGVEDRQLLVTITSDHDVVREWVSDCRRFLGPNSDYIIAFSLKPCPVQPPYPAFTGAVFISYLSKVLIHQIKSGASMPPELSRLLRDPLVYKAGLGNFEGIRVALQKMKPPVTLNGWLDMRPLIPRGDLLAAIQSKLGINVDLAYARSVSVDWTVTASDLSEKIVVAAAAEAYFIYRLAMSSKIEAAPAGGRGEGVQLSCLERLVAAIRNILNLNG